VVREAGGDVEKAAQALVASANAKGGEDNITVLLIRFDE
jgi:serine/threonine protein phosphatase PrpC